MSEKDQSFNNLQIYRDKSTGTNLQGQVIYQSTGTGYLLKKRLAK